eukprot:TRINITY_DN15008_c1_g2_i1.p1 TRINITY_DN15008_c1_g2~~TRINITY_DN15008_c1_g2_i1.p1  ORF type:complete len:378 (+),score=95.37 TRINITY_DN15008_c1_g2_i1:103-1134(+)
MAPKLKKDKSSSSLGGGAKDKKRVPVKIEDSPEVEFCENIFPSSPVRDIAKLVSTVYEGVKNKKSDILRSGRLAIERLCGEEAEPEQYFALLRAEGLETVAYMAAEGPKEGKKESEYTQQCMYAYAARWLDEVDEMNFQEVPNVVYLGSAIAPYSNDVAHSFLAAVERFSVYRGENAATFLEQGLVRQCHVLLSSHRSPEFCHEVVTVLFSVCDGPLDFFAKYVAAEVGIIKTILHVLRDQPLHMRLQTSTFQLMALWNQQEEFPQDMEYPEKEDIMLAKDKLRAAMLSDRTPTLLARALDNLDRAGLNNQAAWLETIAGTHLSEEGLHARIEELYEMQRQQS